MMPRIGITTEFVDDEQRLSYAYVRAVEQAGGLPMIVPMLRGAAALARFSEMLDALVITGGPAIEKGLVGALPADIGPTPEIRAESDRRMLQLFRERRKPVLGICYGMQLINAEAGGTIYADVQGQHHPEVETHSSKRGGTSHNIRMVPESHLSRVLGVETLEVNTRHIQAVATVGSGFRVSALADDGVIEAIESEDGLVLGVQFHPERHDPEGSFEKLHPLFQHLVNQARFNV